MIENTLTALERDDLAFFNSVLSYGIYTDREWMLGLNQFGKTDSPKTFEETVSEAAFSLYSDNNPDPAVLMKRNYELYLYAYIKDNFEKFSLAKDEEFSFSSRNYGYETKCQFQESDYITLNNLARAGYFLSNNPDGTKNLHLVFRGTDNKARNFMDFVGKAYLDMSAYYDAFKPLEAKILEYAKNPDNNIQSIHVSGHSLGGAMVQEFFNSKHVKESGIKIHGFTYGAPGTDKKPIHEVITNTFYTIKSFTKKRDLSSFLALSINVLSPLVNKVLPNSLAITNILGASFGFNLYDYTQPVSQIEDLTPFKIDDRIHQYEHSGDLIPKLGAAAYNETGKDIYLKDVASKNSNETFMLMGYKEKVKKYNSKFSSFLAASFSLIKKPIRFMKNMFSFQYHDMMRYVVNIEHKIISTKTNDSSITTHYDQFKEYKERFVKNTTNKQTDLIYQRIVKKEESEKKFTYIRVPKEVEEQFNNFHYAKTTKNVVADLLGRHVNYSYDKDKIKFTIKDSDTLVNTSINIENLLKPSLTTNIKKQLEQPIFKGLSTSPSGLQINKIHMLRDKFLKEEQEKNIVPKI